MYNNQNLLPLSTIIQIASKRGIYLGKGTPENRIAYFVKTGLIPHAIRKTNPQTGHIEAHFPASILETIEEINHLKRKNYSPDYIKNSLVFKSPVQIQEQPVILRKANSSKSKVLFAGALVILISLIYTNLLLNLTSTTYNAKDNNVLGIETFIAPAVEEGGPLETLLSPLLSSGQAIGRMFQGLGQSVGTKVSLFALGIINNNQTSGTSTDLVIKGKGIFAKDIEGQGNLKIKGTATIGKLITGIVDPYLIVNDGNVQPQLEIMTTPSYLLPSSLGTSDIIFEPGGVEALRIKENGDITFNGSLSNVNNITTTGNITTNNITTTSNTTIGGNITLSGVINGNTLSSTSLVFSGSSPSIYPSTTNSQISLNSNGTGAINIGNSSKGDIYLGGGSTSGTYCLITNSNGSLNCAGDITSQGNLYANGGSLKTTATTAYLFNDTATTLNLGKAATTLSIGASTGTTTINNALTVMGSTSLTTTLSVAGTSTFTGNSTFNGRPTFTKAPSLAHTGAWSIGSGSWNASDATVYINPATIGAADNNLLGIAVNGSVKFAVDSEGDTYVNNLILAGSITSATTTIAGDLTVEGNTILGDATTDTLTIKPSTISITGASGTETLDLTGAATQTLTLLNSTSGQVADLNLSDGIYKIGGASGSTQGACGSTQYISSMAVTGGIVTGVGSCITASTAWSGITAPIADLTLAMAGWQSTFNFTNTTGTQQTLGTTDSAATGTTTVNSLGIGLVGTDNAGGANTINGINFTNVTAKTNNTFNALNLGTGYTNFVNSANWTVTAAGAITAASTVQGTQLISTIAIGTAPLTVTSTTKVTNLNADLLDGMDSTAFGDATAANQTTILNRIGTNVDVAGTTTLFARLARIDDTDLGATADAASTTGTIFARLTSLINNVGSDSDASSPTGSVHAKLKDIRADYTTARAANLDQLGSSGSLRAGTAGQLTQYPAGINSPALPLGGANITTYGSYVDIVAAGVLSAHRLVGVQFIVSNTSIHGKVQIATGGAGAEVVIWEGQWTMSGSADAQLSPIMFFYPGKAIPANARVSVRTLSTANGQGPGVFAYFDPI